MSKRTEFLDVDNDLVIVEGCANGVSWGMKYGPSYREFDNSQAPALALAILEAAGVDSKDKAAESWTSAQTAAAYLVEHVGVESAKAKEAAEREALEDAASKLYHAAFPMNPCYKDAASMPEHLRNSWVEAARTARNIFGGTK